MDKAQSREERTKGEKKLKHALKKTSHILARLFVKEKKKKRDGFQSSKHAIMPEDMKGFSVIYRKLITTS